MAALKTGRRNGSARELAQRLGVSERTIRNYVAEPREQYEARVSEPRQQRHGVLVLLRAHALNCRRAAPARYATG